MSDVVTNNIFGVYLLLQQHLCNKCIWAPVADFLRVGVGANLKDYRS